MTFGTKSSYIVVAFLCTPGLYPLDPCSLPLLQLTKNVYRHGQMSTKMSTDMAKCPLVGAATLAEIPRGGD
jgi:hypothetical protein